MHTEQVRLLLSSKPELVTSFPEWMLSPMVTKDLSCTPGVAIAEIAGRDSIAAVLAAVDQFSITTILPTVAYTGTEFGDWEVPIEKCRVLAQRLQNQSVRVLEPVFLGAPGFFWTVAGRYISHLFGRFGFYTPCLACHLYLHAVRIPLAKSVGAALVISGERERHGSRIKLNQVGVALDAYARFMQQFGVDLLMPLRYTDSSEQIEGFVGSDWKEGGDQVQCVLSKNYVDLHGTVSWSESAVRRFFEEFALPVSETIVRAYLNGRTPDYEGIRPPTVA